MIEQILPAQVVSVSTRCDDPSSRLLPEEAAQLGWAVERRTREFTTARACAHQALGILGLPATPILRGPSREPLWPPGVVGSITHCEGYRAAAVAHQVDVLTVGIDAEPHAALPDGVSGMVLVEPEQSWIAGAPREIHWDRVVFSAKESVFKAWFPLTGRWLGFSDAIVTLNAADQQFSVSLLVEPPAIAGRVLTGFHGRFLICDGMIMTSITVLQRE